MELIRIGLNSPLIARKTIIRMVCLTSVRSLLHYLKIRHRSLSPRTNLSQVKPRPPKKSRRACRQARLSSKKGATRTISREVPPAPTHQPPQGGLCIRRNAQELRLGRSQNRRTWGDNLGLCGASTQRASRAVQRGCRSMKETLIPCVLSTQSPSEYLHSMGADIPSFFGSKVCLCTTNCHLSYKDPCPDRGINHSKVVIKEQRNQ